MLAELIDNAATVQQLLDTRLDTATGDLEKLNADAETALLQTKYLAVVQKNAELPEAEQRGSHVGHLHGLLYHTDDGSPAQRRLIPRGAIATAWHAMLVAAPGESGGLPLTVPLKSLAVRAAEAFGPDKPESAYATWVRKQNGTFTHDVVELASFAILQPGDDKTPWCTLDESRAVCRRLFQGEVILRGKHTPDGVKFCKAFQKKYPNTPLPPVLCLEDSSVLYPTGLHQSAAAVRDADAPELRVWDTKVTAEALWLCTSADAASEVDQDRKDFESEIDSLESDKMQLETIASDLVQEKRDLVTEKSRNQPAPTEASSVRKRRRADDPHTAGLADAGAAVIEEPRAPQSSAATADSDRGRKRRAKTSKDTSSKRAKPDV
jgi:hypothetical protein